MVYQYLQSVNDYFQPSVVYLTLGCQTIWSLCNDCSILEIIRECRYCIEISKILDVNNELEVPVSCITEHPGLKAVCLNVWVFKQLI